MTKPVFFYAHGTAYALQLWDKGFDINFTPPVPRTKVVLAGIDGRTALFDNSPQNDPFPSLVDPDMWTVTRIGYPAAQFPMSWSIGTGVTKTINAIRALPRGTKFALGGYSQGAAVMSQVYKTIQSGVGGSGLLANRATDFIGGVMFGNPCREVNRTWPGGLWSGKFNDDSVTTGGHGSFPASWRLTGTEDKWWEFVNLGDPVNAVGDDTIGVNWVEAAADLLDMDLIDYVFALAGLNAGKKAAIVEAFSKGGLRTFTDAVGAIFQTGGGGHVAYPWEPPPGYAVGTPTSYQLALSYLKDLAQSVATAPIIVPAATAAGWSTTLTPPV